MLGSTAQGRVQFGQDEYFIRTPVDLFRVTGERGREGGAVLENVRR